MTARKAFATITVVSVMGLWPALARADEPAPPPSEPAPPSEPLAPVADPLEEHGPQPPPLSEALRRPPSQPVPVPNPSPVVLGGRPTPPGVVVAPLEWRRRRFGAVDTAIMLVGGAVTLAAAIIPPQPAHFRGPVLFDEGARDIFRARSLQARYTFRDASDVGVSFAVTWPFFIDALFSAWWLRGSRDVAEQMSLLGLQTFAISGAIQGTTNMLASRERPYGPGCREGDLPPNAIDCTSSSHYRSFFSGHSSFSFTSAALICFNHIELKLLGPPWDTISCAGAYAVATTTATFRMVSDVHYASDIITGALLGTVVGYGVPLLHFRRPDTATLRTGGATIRIVPAAGGAGLVGIF